MSGEIFITSDTNEACSIIASGIPVESMERSRDGRIHMIFQNGKAASEISKKFWAKQLPIDAQTLLTEFRMLKHRIVNL